MKIGINIANLRGQGTSQVGKLLLDGFSSYPQHQFHIYAPKNWTRYPDMHWKSARPSLLNKLITDNIKVPLASQNLDAIFTLGDTGSIFPFAPHLLMVQQPFLAKDPKQLDFKISKKFKLKLDLIHQYFKAGLRRVNHITVQTHFMKEHLSSLWSIDPHIISIQRTPIDIPLFDWSPKVENRVIWLTSDGPHKNLDILTGLQRSLSKDIEIVLTLPKDSKPLRRASQRLTKLSNNVKLSGRMDHSSVLHLASSAQVALLPSKLESFGMPYYEAMALGLPIVAADLPFAREACGDCALYADPNQPQDFAEKVNLLLENSELHEQLAKKGPERYAIRIKKPSDICNNYLDILKTLI